MVLSCRVRDEFHSWLSQEVSEEERVGILLEISFIDTYMYSRWKQHIFCGEAKAALSQVQRLTTSKSFQKHVTDTIVALCHASTDEYTAYEIARMKTEQIETACDFYIRFLRRRLSRENPLPSPAKRVVRKGRGDKEKLRARRELQREIKDFLALTPDMARKLKELLGAEGDPFRHPEIRTLCKVKLFTLVANEAAIDKDILEKSVPARLVLPARAMLAEFEEEGLLYYKGEEWIFRPYPGHQSARDLSAFIEGIESERQRLILLLRLHGLSLKAIGDRLFITRERVRQIASRALEKRPTLTEDAWIPAWEKYHGVGKENFCYLFQLREKTVNYLNMVCGHFPPSGNRARLLSEITQDMSLPEEVRFRASRMHLS